MIHLRKGETVRQTEREPQREREMSGVGVAWGGGGGQSERWRERELGTRFLTLSIVSVVSGRKTIHKIKIQTFHSYRHFEVFVLRGFGEKMT